MVVETPTVATTADHRSGPCHLGMARLKAKEGGMIETEFHLLCGGVAPPTNEWARPYAALGVEKALVISVPCALMKPTGLS